MEDLKAFYISRLSAFCQEHSLKMITFFKEENMFEVETNVKIQNLIIPITLKIIFTGPNVFLLESILNLDKKALPISQREILNILNLYNSISIDINTSVFIDKISYIFTCKKEQIIYAFRENTSLENKEKFVETFWSGNFIKMSYSLGFIYYFAEVDYLNNIKTSFTNFFSPKFYEFFKDKLIQYYKMLNKQNENTFFIKDVSSSKEENSPKKEQELCNIKDLTIYKTMVKKLTSIQLDRELNKELDIFKETKDDSKLKILGEVMKDNKK